MTVAVARPTWQSHLARLADQTTHKGGLRSPQWRDALLAIPRHLFIPHYYLQDTSHRPTRWVRHEPGDTDSTRRWLQLVYPPTTLTGVEVCEEDQPAAFARWAGWWLVVLGGA